VCLHGHVSVILGNSWYHSSCVFNFQMNGYIYVFSA
jgi:hypothetical protein